ncbi:MAG: hypothetical protein GX650_04235 [Clostridiales bacterium]|nr:hypothetical protein [Clostridiales bacterium]
MPYGENALIDARNRLVQRGIIDYRKGMRNSRAPAYRMHYMGQQRPDWDEAPQQHPPDEIQEHPDWVADDVTPVSGGNMGGNNKGKAGGNMRGNQGDNLGDLYPDYDRDGDLDPDGTPVLRILNTHRQVSTAANSAAGARARWFDPGDPDAECDEGWRAGEKSRAAIAQRIIDHVLTTKRLDGEADDLHGLLCDLMRAGMHPSLLVEGASNAQHIRAWQKALLRRSSLMGLDLGERAEAYDLMAKYGLQLNEARQMLRDKADMAEMG